MKFTADFSTRNGYGNQICIADTIENLMIGYVYLDVEADTLEDAKEIAKNTDDGEFIESGFGYLEYDCTEDENGNLIDQ